MKTACFLLCSGVALMSAGCGGESVMNVTGSVTFDGKPLPFGEVEFIPDNQSGDGGGAGFATIRNGQYDTAIDGRGIAGGKYQVRLTGYESEPSGNNEDETASTGEQAGPLFHGYAISAEIKSPTYDISVPADAAGFSVHAESGQTTSNEP